MGSTVKGGWGGIAVGDLRSFAKIAGGQHGEKVTGPRHFAGGRLGPEITRGPLDPIGTRPSTLDPRGSGTVRLALDPLFFRIEGRGIEDDPIGPRSYLTALNS